VWGGLVQSLLMSGARLALVRHSIRPLLSRREVADLLPFGLGATASGWANYLALNGDNLVVGRLMGPAALGLYSRAYALMNLPYSGMASVVSAVMFPVFARVQHDRTALRRGYLLLTGLTATVAASAMGTIAIVAPHLVSGFYGPQWTGLVAPLQILCLAGYFRALYHLGGIVAKSVGWVYRELRCQLVYAGLVLCGAAAGAQYGLAWVAAGVGVAIVYMFIATGRLALRATNTPWRLYVNAQLGAVGTAAVTCGAAASTRLMLEAAGASSVPIAIAVVSVAAIPATAGVLWTLGAPDCAPLRDLLPRWSARLATALRGASPGEPIPASESAATVGAEAVARGEVAARDRDTLVRPMGGAV
jgi:O-antigen/teichoic acid export membrane protein